MIHSTELQFQGNIKQKEVYSPIHDNSSRSAVPIMTVYAHLLSLVERDTPVWKFTAYSIRNLQKKKKNLKISSELLLAGGLKPVIALFLLTFSLYIT